MQRLSSPLSAISVQPGTHLCVDSRPGTAFSRGKNNCYNSLQYICDYLELNIIAEMPRFILQCSVSFRLQFNSLFLFVEALIRFLVFSFLTEQDFSQILGSSSTIRKLDHGRTRPTTHYVSSPFKHSQSNIAKDKRMVSTFNLSNISTIFNVLNFKFPLVLCM